MINHEGKNGDKKVLVSEIHYNTKIHGNRKFPTEEVVYIPLCLLNSERDYSWYVRSHLEHKYKVEVLGFKMF